MKWLAGAFAIASLFSLGVTAQVRRPPQAVLYEGARLIIGDAARRSRTARSSSATAASPRSDARARWRRRPAAARRSHRQDRDAGDDQRARAHRLRGLHQLGRGELHAAERPRSPAARGVLRRRRDAVGRQQPDRRVDPVSGAIRARASFAPASRFFFMPGMAPPNGGPDRDPDEGHRRAARRLRSVDRGARRAPPCGGWRSARSGTSRSGWTIAAAPIRR